MLDELVYDVQTTEDAAHQLAYFEGLHALDTLLTLPQRVARGGLARKGDHVDVLAANGETDWMVHFDGIHANDLGHRIIANQIFEVLAQNCSALAQKTKKLEKTSLRWRDESMLKADYKKKKDN